MGIKIQSEIAPNSIWPDSQILIEISFFLLSPVRGKKGFFF